MFFQKIIKALSLVSLLFFLLSLYISLNCDFYFSLIIVFIFLFLNYFIFFNILIEDLSFYLEFLKTIVVFKILITSFLVIIFTLAQIKEVNVVLTFFYSFIFYLFFYKINKNFVIKKIAEKKDEILNENNQKKALKKIISINEFIIYLLKPEE